MEESLRESEQRLQAILDGSDNAFYVKDLEGRFILINKHLEELFGMQNVPKCVEKLIMISLLLSWLIL